MLGRIGLQRYQAVAPAAAARLSTAVRAAAASGQAAADTLNAPLSETDPELFDIIEHEKLRQAQSKAYALTRGHLYALARHMHLCMCMCMHVPSVCTRIAQLTPAAHFGVHAEHMQHRLGEHFPSYSSPSFATL